MVPILLSACYGTPPCDDNETADVDNDGFSVPIGGCHIYARQDCNDSDPEISPVAEEICGNAIDENCDGIVAGAATTEVCGNGLDDDCDGEVDERGCR